MQVPGETSPYPPVGPGNFRLPLNTVRCPAWTHGFKAPLGNALPTVSSSREVYRTGRDALTEDEVAVVIKATTSYQDEALLRLAIVTGIRREDLVAIPLEGIDLTGGEITYYESKKKRTRTIHIGGETPGFLAKHVDNLPAGSRFLFPGREAGVRHISGKTAWNILDRALRAAGLKPRPFHALRATCVKLAQKRGWSVEKVAELTGDTPRTIQTHYSTPSADEMAQVARERPIL